MHRDLKPENIFLTKDEDGSCSPKSSISGSPSSTSPVAEEAGQARLTREGAVFGTPAYMSPEQVKGQGQVDHRADLWALGCMTYECFTGRTVWSTEQGVAMTFAQIASAPLPDPLCCSAPIFRRPSRAWFEKALARSPDDRFQTAKELADELARSRSPIRASRPYRRSPIGVESSTRPARRSTRLPSERGAHAEPAAGVGGLEPTAFRKSDLNLAGPLVSAGRQRCGQPYPLVALVGGESAQLDARSRRGGGSPQAQEGRVGRAMFTLLGVRAITGGRLLRLALSDSPVRCPR